jgi:hypothetical protein
MSSCVFCEKREKTGVTVIFDAKTEGERQYQDNGEAYFTVMWKEKISEKPSSCSYRVREMHEVLERYSAESRWDVYQSQHWFERACRMKAYLKGMGTSFFDADYYKEPNHQGKAPSEVWKEMLTLFEEKGYPLPSSVLCSGQGLYVKWYFSTSLGRERLAYWDILQMRFVEVFRSFGADPASRDASRVLRILGTYNQKNAGRVEVVWLNEDAGQVRCYDFWELFEAFGCSTLVHKQPNRRIQRVEKMPTEKELRAIVSETDDNREMLSRRAVSFACRGLHIVSDLKKLAAIRGWDHEGIPDGQRDLWLFWLVNHVCLSYITCHQPRNYHEALAEAQPFIPKHWSRNKFLNKMSALYQKAKEMASGHKWLSFGGKVWPLYYTPSNERLCEDLNPTPSELEQLDYLRTEETRAAQQKRKRHEAGMLDRGDYLVHAQERRDFAKMLRSEGKTLREIADLTGLTRDRVKSLLRD